MTETGDTVRGQRLRAARMQRGLTQRQVAAAVGMDSGAIGALEGGRRRVPYARFLAIAAYLGLPANAWIVPPGVVGGVAQEARS